MSKPKKIGMPAKPIKSNNKRWQEKKPQLTKQQQLAAMRENLRGRDDA